MKLTLLNHQTAIERAILDALRLAFQQRQSVADPAALAALAVDAAPDGALCYVVSEGHVYAFDLFSGAAAAAGVVVPATPPAKYPAARWIASSSAVNYGPNSAAPLRARATGYVKRVDLFRGQGGTEQGLLALLDVKPGLLLLWEDDDLHELTSGFPGTWYENTLRFSVWCVSENDRGAPWAAWGSPLPLELASDPGVNALAAQVRYLLGGIHGTDPASPRGTYGLDGLLWTDVGPASVVSEDYQQRRFIVSVEVKARCRLFCPDEDLTAIPPASIWLEPRIGDTPPPTFDRLNYVAQGYQIEAGPGLARTYGPGVAVVAGTPVSSTPSPYTFTAEMSTYRDLLPNGALVYQAVIPGAAAPAVTTGALRVGVTTTDSTQVIADRLLCSVSLRYRPTGQVVP